MMETPRRRIPVNSSLHEVSTDHLGNKAVVREEAYSAIGSGISDKNNSAEDVIGKTNGLFRRHSCCSVKQKTLGLVFLSIPGKRKSLGILYHGTNIEAKSHNFVQSHSREEKNARNSISLNRNRSKL
jgi:hypothetical protein